MTTESSQKSGGIVAQIVVKTLIRIHVGLLTCFKSQHPYQSLPYYFMWRIPWKWINIPHFVWMKKEKQDSCYIGIYQVQ